MGLLGKVGDIAGGLFGKAGKSKAFSMDLLNDQQKGIFEGMLNSMFGDYRRGSWQQNPTAADTMSLRGLEGLAANLGKIDSRGTDAQAMQGLSTANNRLQQIMTQGPADINKYFNDTVQKPLVSQYTNEVLPQLRARFGANFYGGERGRAQDKAIGNLSDQLTTSRSKIAYDARQSDINSSLQAAQLLPGLSQQMSVQPFASSLAKSQAYNSIFEGTDRYRQIGQQNIQNKMAAQNMLYQMLGLRTKENIFSQGQAKEGSAGSIAALAGAAAMFMSDRRMKMDIEEVGALPNGLKVYQFRYKHNPLMHPKLGVMADEVLKINPAAVHDIDGVLYVDYAEIL